MWFKRVFLVILRVLLNTLQTPLMALWAIKGPLGPLGLLVDVPEVLLEVLDLSQRS